VNCTLNGAILSIKQNDTQRASSFLQKIRDVPELYSSPSSYRTYLTLISQVELLNGHPAQAEGAARSAMALDDLDPSPQLVLAVALVLQGKTAEATRVENNAISLLTPQEQLMQRKKFETLLKSQRLNR
jgi:predicted Zn-dependent protease